MLIRKVAVSFCRLNTFDIFIGFKPRSANHNFIILAGFQEHSISSGERILFFAVNDNMKSSKIIRYGSRCNFAGVCVQNEFQPFFSTRIYLIVNFFVVAYEI